MPTTFRSDVVAALVTVLQAQQTADPASLRAIYTSRPGSVPETPCAYIGPRDEIIRYDAGTRTREFRGLTVVVVDALQDASETEDRLDDLVDALVDRFTAAYAAVAGGGSIVQLNGARDTDVVLSGGTGEVTYRGVVLDFGGTFISEGRV